MFPAQTLTFLRGLARNNNRDWFNARKEIYETQVKAPMIAMIEQINAELMDFAPEFVTDPKKSFYRIYRDTRFSADKTPYKTHIAAIFPPRGFAKHGAAGFYFHVSPKNVAIGGGNYMPGPEELRAVRTWLAENHVAFRKAGKSAEKLIGQLQGSAAARTPKGFDSEHPADDLVRMKQWIYWSELDADVATSPKLLDEIVQRFRTATPMIRMLNAGLVKSNGTSL